MHYVENRTFDEISIGETAELSRTFDAGEIALLSVGGADEAVAQCMWGGALVAAVLGTALPGPGTLYHTQTLRFLKPVHLGEQITARVEVKARAADTRRLMLDCLCLNAAGEPVLSGEAEVTAPAAKIRRPRVIPPEVHVHARGGRYRHMVEATRDLAPIRVAVVHPCDAVSLEGAFAARAEGLIEPVLVGPAAKIRAAAEAAGLDLSGVTLIDVPHSHAAAARAVMLARSGEVEALMKGSLHTDEIMEAVVAPDTGLRTERRISHIFALDVPHYHKPLFVTDAAINIAPSLEDKRDIVQNAIDFCRAIGLTLPKVAILSAVETITPKLPSTVDAAALCKMAERGQITGGLLDGPLAFDNAVSPEAARLKNIVSDVAGDADVLVAPDLEAGNMIAKQLVYLGGADTAGLVLGARVPIMLTSRADGRLARTASCALAKRLVHSKLSRQQ